jgi:two-component system response regulator RegA
MATDPIPQNTGRGDTGSSPQPSVTPTNSEDHRPTLMLVDDDEIFRERLAKSFRIRDYEVATANNFAEAEELATRDSPEFAVVDLRMPGQSGLELVKRLKQIDPSTKIIVLTGYGSIATAVDAIKLGASNYLSKPADADDIIAAFLRGTTATIEDTPSEPRAETPSLARAEWEHIHRVLSDCSGNISEAARRLGIHRRSLQRKLQKYAPRT